MRLARYCAPVLLGVVALMTAAIVATLASPAHADEGSGTKSGSRSGCPRGAVCIYSGSGDLEHVYWSYGRHKLHNEYGWHRIFNNQTDMAHAYLCKDAAGKDCTPSLGDVRWNLDLYNYIWLSRKANGPTVETG